jgi:prolyl oligopeptidase
MKLTASLFVAAGLALFLSSCASQADKTSASRSTPAGASMSTSTNDTNADPYLWLEDVTGERALAWVRQQNALSTNELTTRPDFEPARQRLLTILDSKERIPAVSKHGRYYYNFWRDSKNVRGLWRRTTLDEYRKSSPAWETVLDLDQVAATEKENWVWKGASVLDPDYDRCLLHLSRGGADASVIREFDLERKEFVSDGFTLKEAKSRVSWRNRDSLYVGTDFGPGSLTKSGYPRIVKEWQRGTPLEQARTVYEGKAEDVSVGGFRVRDHGRVYEFVNRAVTFFTDEVFLRQGDKWVQIDKPADAEVSTFGEHLLIKLRSEWKVGSASYASGSLLAANFDAYLKGERKFSVLFTPTERKSLSDMSDTKNFLLLTELENVRSRPYFLRYADGDWQRTPLEAPAFGTVAVSGIDADESDDYFMTTADFVTPSSLYFGTIGQPGREKLKSLPAFFKSDGLEIQQFEATSRDGTRVPYFQVSRQGLDLNGRNPTLLYGYGGFEISMMPNYSPGMGASWLEKGGTYILANIRGGGEFGPRWHEAARKANRQRAYDDFIAVAEDVIRRKVTSPQHLGIQGGSNGGLLMGVMLTQRPDLFGAVVCQVPLLDMRRFHKLLAGASWVDEYGNPEQSAEWEYISKYSPYQNVRRDRKYPKILFTTSTRDDRVHPGHARKMVARMKEYGKDVLYFENIEGGHGGAADNKQAAFMNALAYTYLWKQLGTAN